MNFTYFRFLGRSLSKKWYIWILLILYVAIAAAFLLLVPTLLKTDPWSFWGNTTVLPQGMLMMVGALLSAVLGIAIFRDYSDDGTELIIVSKPINRTKIIMTKFIMFVTFSIGFAALSIFVDLGTFAFQSAQDNPSLVGSLILSTFISNLILTLVLGFLAILISLFMNKVWTILLNVIIVTLLTIYTTVTYVVAKTPSKVASDHTSYVNTIQYINNGGGVDMAAALSPIDMGNMQNPLAFDDTQGQIAKWAEYTKESASKSVLPLDLILQFSQMNNMFGLGDYQEEQARNYFDYARGYSYGFNDELVADRSDFKTLPMFVPMIHQIDYPEWEDPPTDPTQFMDWANKMLPKIFNTYTQYQINQNIGVLGYSHNSTEGLFAGIRNAMDVSQNGFEVAQANFGWNGSDNDRVGYTFDELDKQTKPGERSLFSKILRFFETKEATKVFLGYADLPDYEIGAQGRTAPWINIINNQEFWKRLVDIPHGINTLFADGDLVGKANIEKVANDIKYDKLGVPINNIYDFLHLILVSNKTSLSSYQSDKYRNDEASALLETMVKLRLFWFEKISKKFQNSVPDLKSAANTATNMSIDIPGTEFNFNFNTSHSPILPLASSEIDGNFTYLQNPATDIEIKYKSDNQFNPDYNVPTNIELKLDKVMWNGQQLADLIKERMILDNRSISPSLYDDFSSNQILDILLAFNTLTNIVFPNKDVRIPQLPFPSSSGPIQLQFKEIVNQWQSPFFGPKNVNDIDGTNTAIWMDRAIENFATDSEEYGWEDGSDPTNFDRNTRYTGRLYTDSSMNYPVMYQNLMSTYHVVPNMQNGYIVLGWFCCAIVLMSLCLVVFVRKDFK